MNSTAGVQINASLDGLGVELAHGPSGAQLGTQPPKDNGGTGACFSPTDLVAAALASCALTTMALTAKREGLGWGKASAQVEKHMSSAPRRIAALPLRLSLPAAFPEEHRARYEQIARTCPVALSLHPSVQLDIRCEWTCV